MLTIQPAGVSGQQAYLSNVLLQNKPVINTNKKELKNIFAPQQKAIDFRWEFE